MSIKVSFGVKIWRADESEDELFAAADAALYRAKEGGRNRVCLAGDPMPLRTVGPTMPGPDDREAPA